MTSMSRSETLRSETETTKLPPSSEGHSPSQTVTDLTATLAVPKAGQGAGAELPSESTLGKVEHDLEKAGKATPGKNVLASLPPGRKTFLLLCFCLSMFIDAAGVSATFLMTAPIAEDLHIVVADEAWILGTYSMVFAATLLFAGRLADLYAPHRIYTLGFVGLAIFSLITSFMDNRYAFYVMRAISALLAVWTIPSSINMIIQMYPDPVEQGKKLALFGLAGALANTISLILAGVFLLASWRWFFRFITIIVLPFSILAWFMMPKTEAVASGLPGWDKWKRMDLGGVVILIATLVLFILGFTQAPISGWNSAIFIAPFMVSIALVPVFLFWEKKMPRGYSLLPHDIWSFPNIFPLILQATAPFMWFATVQLRVATYFQTGLGNSPILAAVKLLPMGITALFVGAGIQAFPALITKPKYVQPVASALAFAGSMIIAFSGGGHGSDYWRYMFPGQVVGTIGAMVIFIGMNTSVIQAFPVEFAGVGGSFANIIFQVGGVVGIAVQAGLIATGNGTLEDWTGSKNSYFFSSAYVLATGLIFMVWYKPQKAPAPTGAAVVA